MLDVQYQPENKHFQSNSYLKMQSDKKQCKRSLFLYGSSL